MNQNATYQKLSNACRVFGFFLLALTLARLSGYLFLNESSLALISKQNLNGMTSIAKFCSAMALSYFFLYLSKVIEESYSEESSSIKQKYCNITFFFLGLQSGYDVTTTLVGSLKMLQVLNYDYFSFVQVFLFQGLDTVYRCIPAVLGFVLYSLSKNYDRLLAFEKEVI